MEAKREETTSKWKKKSEEKRERTNEGGGGRMLRSDQRECRGKRGTPMAQKLPPSFETRRSRRETVFFSPSSRKKEFPRMTYTQRERA